MKISLPKMIEIKTRKADNRGRFALGSEYADKKVTVIILDTWGECGSE